MIQPLAYVHPQAKIADNVVIEPFATIHKNVEIGEGTWIGSNVTIMDGAHIGKNCRIFPGAVISAIPQDLKFEGEDSQRSEEHTSELQSLMRISYAVFCLKKKKTEKTKISRNTTTH